MIVPMFTLAGLTIDGSRIVASKSMISDTGDLTINAALTEYDHVLKDVYGLFGISKTTEELESNLRVYFQSSLTGKGKQFSLNKTLQSNGAVSRAVDLRLNNFMVEGLNGSELTSPVILEKQILEFMKYRGIVSAVNGFQTKLQNLGDLDRQSLAISSKIEFDKELNNLQYDLNTAYDRIMKYKNGPINNYFNSNSSISLNDKVNESLINCKNLFANGTFFQMAVKSYDGELKTELSKNIPHKPFEKIQNDLKISLDNPNSEARMVISKVGGIKVSNFDDMVAYLINLKRNSNLLNNLYFDIQVYEKSYKDHLSLNKVLLLGSELNRLEDEYQQRLNTKTEIINFFDRASYYQKKLNSEALSLFASGKSEIVNFNQFFKERVTELQKAVVSLNDVLKQCKQIKDEKNKYRGNLNQLNKTDLKNALATDFHDNADNIDTKQVGELISALEKNISKFNQYSLRLNKVSFYNMNVLETDIKTLLLKTKPVDLNSINSLISTSQKVVDKSFTYKTLLSDNGIIQINEGISFFNYMMKATQPNSSEIAKKEAESKKETLLSLADKKITPIHDTNSNGITVSSLLPSQFLSNNSALNASSTQEIKIGQNFTNIQSNIFNDLYRHIANVSSLSGVALEKLLVEEYITEMFSCYSDDVNRLNLNGFSLNPHNNVIFKNEIEYILWGNDVAEKNVSNTMNLLLGIRFLLNSSYAFSSPEIRAITTSLATAIAGWTVFGVPVIQTTLTLAFALAESKLDIEDLKNGKSVPIIKNSGNWKCSLSGLSTIMLQETQKFADQQINNVFTAINNFSIEKTDELINSIDYFTNNTIQGAIDSAKGEIVIPIRAKTTDLIKNPVKISKEDISTQINFVFDEIRKSVGTDQNEAFRQIKITGLNLVESNYKQMLVNQIIQLKSQTDINNIVNTGINKLFDQINNSLTSQLNSLYMKIGDRFKTDITRVVNSKEDNIKGIVREKITNFSQKFSTAPSKEVLLGNLQGPLNSKGIALTYKDYLKLFITLGLIDDSNKKEMLNRVASLIQINISKGKQNLDNGKAFQKNPNFNLSKRFTFIKLNANVGVKTNFLKLVNQSRYSSGNINLTSVNNQFYNMPYKTVGGY
jgi:hypothetical protein